VVNEKGKQTRLSISIPAELAAFARDGAKAGGVSVSAFVAAAVRKMVHQELEQRIIDGLIEDAERDRAIAADWEGASR
jgi:metal-responsive CopG/Arc/MetJ family transcriptional regulator